MGEKSKLFQCEEKMPTYDAAVVLEKLVDGLKQRKLSATGEAGPVCVDLPLLAEMEINFKDKSKPGKSKKKLSIEISWKEGDAPSLDG